MKSYNLIILLIVSLCTPLSTMAQFTNNESAGVTPYDFSNTHISYAAQFSHLKYGFYGVGFEALNENGFGGTFSVHGNWGLQPEGADGQLMFKFGPQYGYVVHPNVMLSAALRGFIYTYDQPKEDNPKDTDMKVNGGITLTPKLNFRYDRFIFGLGYEVGWQNKLGKLCHNAEITIGYNF